MTTAGLDTRRAARGWRDRVHRAARVLRRIIGAPDYEAYAAHRLEKHAGEETLSRDEFALERQRARYERPGARCC
jgi:uncharacterized short protein YbdD (DUF466 family)